MSDVKEQKVNLTKNMKDYKKKYFQEHREKYMKHMICEVCNGPYNLNGKSYHLKSKRHLTAVELKAKDEQIKKLNSQLNIIKNDLNNIISSEFANVKNT